MFLLGIKGFCNFSMIKKKLNRFEYIRLTKTNKMFFAEIFNKDYQKLKVGDKVLCYYENEEIEAYVTKLIYVFPEENIIDNIFFDEDKYGKVHIYLSLDYNEEDYSYYVNEYFEYKKLLEESNRVNFNILSKVVPTNIERTKVVMPCKIINPLLMDNLISNMFNLPKRVLHHLMNQSLVIDTMDDEFIARRCVEVDGDIYLTGIDAINYLFKKLDITHLPLKEEDIFINEIYVYPQYWEKMFAEDNKENDISFAYRSLVNRCRFITMLKNDESSPKLVLENEKRMMYEKNVYLLERFINDGLLIKRY